MSKPYLKFHGISPINRQNIVLLQTDKVQSAICAVEEKSHNIADFADFAPDAIEPETTTIESTPLIPNEVYENLPELLKTGCDVFQGRERDMFLTGALAILSGCFDAVSGLYDGRKVYANLFAFIVAGAGNGKGVLIFAKALGQRLHKAIKEASISQANTSNTPVRTTLFIPANSSAAAFIKLLVDNGGSGIMCETEADALSDTLNQDWGNFSHLIRGGFQHESVSYARKLNNELGEIDNPRLSILLSGTPGQFQKLIKSIDNGLFSRFMFYTFAGKRVWRDVSPAGKTNLTTHFEALSERVFSMANTINSNAINFELTQSQWSTLNSEFSQRLEAINQFDDDDDAGGSVLRLGLITFRIAMLLSVVRAASAGTISENIICSDIDFTSALTISGIYMQHALFMMDTLPKTASTKPNAARLYDALPIEFQRKEAVSIGARMNIRRSVDTYLSEFVAIDKLEKITGRVGWYKKK